MIYGAITNSWREQLPSQSVKELMHQQIQIQQHYQLVMNIMDVILLRSQI